MNVQSNQIQQIGPDQYAQSQADMQRAKRMQALADTIGQKQYGATSADLIAALVDGFAKAKANKNADEKWSSAYEKAMAYEQQEKQRQAQAQAEAEQRKREQAIEDHRRKKMIDKEMAGPQKDSGKEVFSMEKGLRDAFVNDTKSFASQNDAFGRIYASAKDPSPAGDMSLIFNFMKVLDPGSTVREGEFANAQNSGSVDQRIRGLYNSVLEGTRLSPEQRHDFVKRAADLYGQAKSDYTKRVESHKGLAAQYSDYGVNPDRVTFSRDLYDPDQILSEFGAPAPRVAAPQGAQVEGVAKTKMKDANGNLIEAVVHDGRWVNAQTGELL